GIFRMLPKGVRDFLGVSGGGSSGASLASIGSKIAAKFGFGSAASVPAAAAAPGLADAAFGFAPAAKSGGWFSGGGAGIGAWGAAVPLAIGAYGFSRQSRKKAKRRALQQQFFTQVGTGITEPLGEGAWDFRGMLSDAEAFFSTTRAGWQSTMKALEEAGVLTKGWGAQLDENGRGLVKIQGDIDGVKTALSNATVTGFSFAGSLTTAMEKGNALRVSIQGDSEVIKTALNAATAMGIGGFRNLETTATGVSATLTGDIARWQEYLQAFVNEAIRSAISGVGALGNEAGDATKRFLELAEAAAKVRAGGSSIRAPDGSHAGGLPYVPFDGYQAVLHQGERVLTRQENLRYATPTQPVDIRPLLAEVQALKQAVLASGSNVRQGVDETTRQVKKQARGYTRRVV
ncbi:MAG: hypothetical protein DWQ08_08735, partial [Proteobacteria bacterium]